MEQRRLRSTRPISEDEFRAPDNCVLPKEVMALLKPPLSVFTNDWLYDRARRLAALYFPDVEGSLHTLPYWKANFHTTRDRPSVVMPSWQVLKQVQFVWDPQMVNFSACTTCPNYKKWKKSKNIQTNSYIVKLSQLIHEYLDMYEIDSSILHEMIHVMLFFRCPKQDKNPSVFSNHYGTAFQLEMLRINLMGDIQVEVYHRRTDQIVKRLQSQHGYTCQTLSCVLFSTELHQGIHLR